MEEKILLFIARLLIEKNEDSALTGSLMLYVRGLKKRREAHDIDILVKDIAAIFVPDEFSQASPQYPDSIKFKCGDLVVDFLLNQDEEIEIVNGVPCGNVDKLLQQKCKYSKQSSEEEAKKHKEDLEFINYEFPKQEQVEIDLPY
jgi:hypothetical protein